MAENKYPTDSRGERTPIPRPLMRSRANSPPTSSRPAASLAFTASGDSLSWERYQSVPEPPEESGFFLVPRTMPKGELLRSLLNESPPLALVKFSSLNPLPDLIKANSLIVLGDPRNRMCTPSETALMEVAERVQTILEPLTSEEADFLARYRDDIAAILGETSMSLGITSSMLSTHLQGLKGTLGAIERLHQDSFRQHGHLRSPEFFAERTRLLAQLDAHLQAPLVRRSLDFAEHHKLKRAMGISSSSLVHHWSKAGGVGQIPGYATHLDKVTRASTYMKAGGYVGVGVGGVASALHVQEVCGAAPDSPVCERVKFTEGGKFLGGWGGGSLGATIASSSSGAICLALGITTGVGGAACVVALVGVGALAGAGAGASFGESTGGYLHGVIRQ